MLEDKEGKPQEWGLLDYDKIRQRALEEANGYQNNCNQFLVNWSFNRSTSE